MTVDDPYRDWDAAYVMGSLTSSERHEYETHLANCPDCAAGVADLAGLSGILSAVPADEAAALLPGPELALGAEPPAALAVPPQLLTRVLARADLERRRQRLRMAGIGAGLLAAAAAVTAAIVLVLGGPTADPVAMTQTVSSPITAEATLVEESWGTTIEVTCWYADEQSSPDDGAGGDRHSYDLYVTDTAGTATAQASWTASPGTVATPRATTLLPIDQIRTIEIRLADSDLVLLTLEP